MTTGVAHFFDSNRFTSVAGTAEGGLVYFYYTGTTNLAPIYSDSGLTTPLVNPVPVAVGAILPAIFLDPSIVYRRRIVFTTDGSVHDEDPVASAFNTSELLRIDTAEATYETIAHAASTYETASHAAATYETIAHAASTYETASHASSTYETITHAAATYSPVPINSSGVGQFMPLPLAGSSSTLPAGGTWAYYGVNNGSGFAGVAAGGTVVWSGSASNFSGFCWRVA